MLLAYLLRTRLVGPIPYILFSILAHSNSYRSAQFSQPDSATEGGLLRFNPHLGALRFPNVLAALRYFGASEISEPGWRSYPTENPA
jgi:hypothetical protein